MCLPFIKQTVSIQRIVRQGRKWQAFIGERERNKEKKNRQWVRSREVGREPRVGLALGNWLAAYTASPTKQSICKAPDVI